MIVPEGIPFILIPAAAAMMAAMWGNVPATVICLAVTLFNMWFFRNPPRVTPADPLAIISPADGRVLSTDIVREDRLLKGEARKISIFMSPFNVHVNRSPVSGTVTSAAYNKGRFFSANTDKASLDNEQNALLLTAHNGARLLCVQIAGFIARRIICDVKPGDAVTQGARFGLIRYGSRVDLYIPPGCPISVKPGDRVRGGESIVARFP